MITVAEAKGFENSAQGETPGGSVPPRNPLCFLPSSEVGCCHHGHPSQIPFSIYTVPQCSSVRYESVLNSFPNTSSFSDSHTSCEPQALRPVTCLVLRLGFYQSASHERILGRLVVHTTLGARFPHTGHTQFSRERHLQLYVPPRQMTLLGMALSPPPCQQPSPSQPGTSCLPGGGVGRCFPGVLSSHQLEVRQEVPHPANEEAGKNNLDLISWFQAGALTVPTTPAN